MGNIISMAGVIPQNEVMLTRGRFPGEIMSPHGFNPIQKFITIQLTRIDLRGRVARVSYDATTRSD